jgi:hypothetical protein
VDRNVDRKIFIVAIRVTASRGDGGLSPMLLKNYFAAARAQF